MFEPPCGLSWKGGKNSRLESNLEHRQRDRGQKDDNHDYDRQAFPVDHRFRQSSLGLLESKFKPTDLEHIAVPQIADTKGLTIQDQSGIGSKRRNDRMFRPRDHLSLYFGEQAMLNAYLALATPTQPAATQGYRPGSAGYVFRQSNQLRLPWLQLWHGWHSAANTRFDGLRRFKRLFSRRFLLRLQLRTNWHKVRRFKCSDLRQVFTYPLQSKTDFIELNEITMQQTATADDRLAVDPRTIGGVKILQPKRMGNLQQPGVPARHMFTLHLEPTCGVSTDQ